jgi:hypothetical protein
MERRQMVERQAAYVFSSKGAGVYVETPAGDRFSVSLTSPLTIPAGAVNATGEVVQSTIWNVSPNISATIGNNVFRYLVDAVSFSFTIPTGLYTLSGLSSALAVGFESNGHASNLITLIPSDATQRVYLRFADAAQADFQADTPFEILGFAAGSIVPAAPANEGESVLAPNTASFNRINYYVLHSSLANGGGIPTNDASDSTIGVVQITARPGSQISSAPVNPLRFGMTGMVGTPLSRVQFWLTDDQLRPVDTLGETWSATIVIRYWL